VSVADGSALEVDDVSVVDEAVAEGDAVDGSVTSANAAP
jgi:hypothetical protein